MLMSFEKYYVAVDEKDDVLLWKMDKMVELQEAIIDWEDDIEK